LFLDLMPRSYVAYYSHLLRTSEWHEADSVFARLLSSAPLDSPLMDFVGGALWDSRGIYPLSKRALSGDASASRLIRRNAARFGWSEEEIGRKREDETPHKEESVDIDVSQFAPSALAAMLEELRKRKVYVAERTVVRKWFDHWREQRRGMEVLHALAPYLDEQRVPWGVAELLDDAFQLSYLLEGKAKAYKWLVCAQVQLFGWDPYYSDEVALGRFKVFGQYYRPRWKDFIQETAKNPFRSSSDSLIIPSHRLVQFFTLIGETSAAVAVTEAMVSVVLEDVADQPLHLPAWFTGD